RPHCRTGRALALASDLSVGFFCQSGRTDFVWLRSGNPVSAGSGIYQPHTARRQACRSASAISDEASTGHQSQDREGARPRNAFAASAARRRGDRVRRRDFIQVIAGSIAAWPLAARAQQAGRMRVGIVVPYPKGDTEYESRVRALRQELAKLGWTEGSNVQFDERWTTADISRVWAEGASLMASNPDVVVATGGRVGPVFMQLARAIPIVVPGVSDPAGVGWVQSLARPGGNVTGFTNLELSIFGKLLETLKQIAPAARRVAFIYNPDNPSAVFFRRAFEAAAPPLAIEPFVVP